MAESIVSDIVVRVLEYAAGSIAKRVAPYFGGRKKLDELRVTLTFIQARLSDAERQHEGERGDLIKRWLEELKCVMYQLEDLFEEIDANDEETEQRSSSSKLSKVVRFLPPKLSSLRMNKKVVRFLPPKLSSLRMNKKVAKEGESIFSKLNYLKDTMNTLDLVPREVTVGNSQSRLNQGDPRETQSFIPEGMVIGRDKDRDVVLDIIFKASNVEDVLSVIPIVGMGGLGKTTLVQFIYNCERVQRFFEFKYWACISDKISNPKELIGKVFQSMSRDDGWQDWDLEKLQCEFREFVKGKHFLLVLDDVWDEDPDWWIRLSNLLCECKPGSVVLVTTRSGKVALNMSTVEPYYELKGLSEDQSWALFESLAFRKGLEESCPSLVNIGREIVKKCANVPLAIRTIAGLLRSKNTEKEWEQFRDEEIGVIDRKDNIMSTLKLSYSHLEPREKQCFAYGSLYPKDYKYDIKHLIWCWMAQGFVRSMDEGHECFMELLRRCFFQDVRRDEHGNMVYCKMHDLMHDLAESVGDECLRLDKPVENINRNTKHVTILIGRQDSLSPLEASWMRASPPIRSFSLPLGTLLDQDFIFLHLRRLRVLDLGEERYKSPPDSIGKLQHLRYFKAYVDWLPDGITNLQNLQVLNVRVKKLPRDLPKLTSLRHLEIRNHDHNCWMPPGIGKLVNLVTLSTFVVENEGLDALAGLNLTGKLTINFKKKRENAISEAKMSNLRGKRLTHLLLWQDSEDTDPEDDDELLKCLPLPSTLKILFIVFFSRVRRLSWGVQDLSNIVCITITHCYEIQQLPSFGRLPHLKRLVLKSNCALEFVENGSGNSNEAIGSSSEAGAIYFPSLEMLWLEDLHNLKGWSRTEDTGIDQQVQQQCQQLRNCFPRLQTLNVDNCRELRSLPWSQFAALNYKMPQMLANLDIIKCDALDLWIEGNNDGNEVDVNSVNLSAWEGLQSLRSLSLSEISRLESLPSGMAALTRLQSLEIDSLDNLRALPEWIGQLTQLRSLTIDSCDLVETLPRSIRNLNALKELYICGCPKLKSRCEKPNGEDWPLIQHIPYLDIRKYKYSDQFD